MARAGYNPEAAIELWTLLNDIESEVNGEKKPEHGLCLDNVPWLRTHPSGEQRLKVRLFVMSLHTQADTYAGYHCFATESQSDL